MAIKRTAPISTQQELQVSDKVVYRFKPSTPSEPAPTIASVPQSHFVVTDLLKTALTMALIVAIVLVVMWRGWLN